MQANRLPQTSDQITLQASLAHKHARKCKKDLKDCETCRANISWFEKQDRQTLSKLLEERYTW